ncbi:aspartyl/asparaginyl beta-hydroxylase domain-containing protein [Hyalangium versicolor]|uniref:aspartyl/asparaginyl beta-hydroxylase domain-containing protein n=1 Tax=Hyalangium versicolor TaxID=2861190 RepID=UPI001CC9F299|nr:aspartyl/asparaginyl beta-hydroxylase domain-containing protein [Hyalangium versicolor]
MLPRLMPTLQSEREPGPTIPDRLRLPLRFDAARLQEDLDRLAPEDWVPHFNKGYYQGEWSGVALRAVGGRAGGLYPDPAAQEPFADTPMLDRCPAVREALSTFGCPLLSARLLKLAAGARIREHRDYNLGYEDGEVRLHIPITTNPEVEFHLEGRRIPFVPGECWYLNFNQPHRVENLGSTDRVHLVVDCVLNDWLRTLFARAVAREELDRFIQHVLSEPTLQRQLLETPEPKVFAEMVQRMGTELGHVFSAEDLQSALQEARRTWRERWV